MKIHFLEFLFQYSVSSLATFPELVSHMYQRIRKKENELEHGKYVFQPPNSRPFAKNTYFANKNESCDLEVPCSSQYCVLKLFLHTSFKKNFFVIFWVGREFFQSGVFYCGCFLIMCLVIHISRTHLNVQNGHSCFERSMSTVLMIALHAVQIISFSSPCSLLLEL